MPPKKDNPGQGNNGKGNNGQGNNGKGNETPRGSQGKKSQGGEGGGEEGGKKGQCAECGAEQNDFNHCVHCAQKLCDSCRMKHVEDLLEDFMKSREDAATIERKIYKKNIQDISDALNGIKVSQTQGERAINAVFKQLEKQLVVRRAELLKELHVKHEEQTGPLLNNKKSVEKELYFASDKFRDACKISITPVRGATASSYNKMPDGEFAQVCVSTTKAKESANEFQEIQNKMEEIASPQQVVFVADEQIDELMDQIQNFGEIKVGDGDEEGGKDSQSAGKGSKGGNSAKGGKNDDKKQQQQQQQNSQKKK